jgi:hypothetical protein
VAASALSKPGDTAIDSISIPEPSLSSRAMLCSLSISMWSARKHDPEASEEIAQRHGAQADAGRYHKVLLPKEALAEIHKIVSEARQEHYFMTLPWDDNGYRVLPAAAYMDHTEKMRALSNRFTPAVEALVHQFGQLVEEAKGRLGGLFRPGDYPAPDELRSKFSFETKVMPLPDAADFRPAFEWVAESDIAPLRLIYLTDLCCDSYPEAPEYPVLWVTDSRRAAPFGETVRITLE